MQAETKIKHDLFQQTYGAPVRKDKPLTQFVEEDYLPWADHNKKQPRHDRGITRIWLRLPSLKGKSVREVSQFDIESAKIEMTRIYAHPSLATKKEAVKKALVTYWSQEGERKGAEKAGGGLKMVG